MIVDGLTVGISIVAARRHLAQAFGNSGCDAPELDARILISHALGLDHTALVTAAERTLDEPEIEAIVALAQRRCAREPVARILGVKEFWGLPLQLSEATLVPRPETEIVVEAALGAIAENSGLAQSLRIADLGTGSGALLLALLSELPQSSGVGTDISAAALKTARANAVALGLGSRAHFAACNFGAALRGGFDVIVSNPPYVARGEISDLSPEVSVYDPRDALDGGVDGHDAYRTIAADARRLLAPQGVLVVEIGASQSASVTALLRVAGFATAAAPHLDLAGLPRAVLAKALP